MPINKNAIVSFVELSTAALDDAHTKLAAAESERQAYLTKVNTVVDRLVATGLLRKDAAANSATVLANPLEALEQLAKLAESKLGDSLAEPADRIGAVTPDSTQKVASATRNNGRVVRQADRDFVRSLGLSEEYA